jgi:sporulation protein YlmC with PRC-barrel domain
MARHRKPRRDQAGVGPDPAEASRHLVSIDDLDGYTIADGEPDIRGWEVTTLSGRELGEVDDLLVDPERGEVVMLELGLRGESARAEVPIRSAQLDRERRIVLVDSADLHTGTPDDAGRGRTRAPRREPVREPGADRPAERDPARQVRYDSRREDLREEDVRADETVVERRPMVEEVVVRRRPVDE